MEAHPLSYYVGVFFGALAVGFFCGLIPAVAGALTKQKRLAFIGFITCLVVSLVGGIVLALPVAVVFGIVIVVKWLRRPEPTPEPTEKRVDA
jgi:hypothetical protein